MEGFLGRGIVFLVRRIRKPATREQKGCLGWNKGWFILGEGLCFSLKAGPILKLIGYFFKAGSFTVGARRPTC